MGELALSGLEKQHKKWNGCSLHAERLNGDSSMALLQCCWCCDHKAKDKRRMEQEKNEFLTSSDIHPECGFHLLACEGILYLN